MTNLPLLPAGSNLKSWSGYITVDETNGANLFYWMFENSAGNTQPPLLIWLNGGQTNERRTDHDQNRVQCR